MASTQLTGLLIAGSLLLGFGVPAHADIITSKVAGQPATGDGYYAFTYDVSLSGGQLDATTTDSGGSPTPLQFGTVYDFGPLARDVAGNVYIAMTGYLSSMFSFTFNTTDAPASQTLPTDNPDLTNIRFIYNGSTTLSAPTGGSDINLGTFTVYSPYSDVSVGIQYDGQSYKTTNDTIQGNVGYTSGPLNPVPEPASIALLAAGLAGLGVARRRKR